MARVYLSPPHLTGTEVGALHRAIDSGWIAPLGPEVDAFEREFADAIGVAAAAAVSSGTAALHLALVLLGVGEGDTVACSDLTFAASANPIRYVGADPVFVDASSSTWTMDPALLAELLADASRDGSLPRAVIVVDLYGQSADHDAIRGLCDEYSIPIVEDAAEALGATYRGTPVGRFGELGAFSFNGNKIITTSGGGMLVSDDPDTVARAKNLASQARDPFPHYEHSTLGYNYRMSNLLAAIGREQLSTLDQRVATRRGNFDRYYAALSDLPGVGFMPEAEYGRSTRWLSCIMIDPEPFGADRDDVRLALEAVDIEARPLWKPMHMQPLYAKARFVGGRVGERLFETGLCLPSGSNLDETDANRVVEVIRSVARF